MRAGGITDIWACAMNILIVWLKCFCSCFFSVQKVKMCLICQKETELSIYSLGCCSKHLNAVQFPCLSCWSLLSSQSIFDIFAFSTLLFISLLIFCIWLDFYCLFPFPRFILLTKKWKLKSMWSFDALLVPIRSFVVVSCLTRCSFEDWDRDTKESFDSVMKQNLLILIYF